MTKLSETPLAERYYRCPKCGEIRYWQTLEELNEPELPSVFDPLFSCLTCKNMPTELFKKVDHQDVDEFRNALPMLVPCHLKQPYVMTRELALEVKAIYENPDEADMSWRALSWIMSNGYREINFGDGDQRSGELLERAAREILGDEWPYEK